MGEVRISDVLLYIMQVDESGQIICLEYHCPWRKHLTILTTMLSLPETCIKFVLFKHVELDTWVVQASDMHRPVLVKL